jgi:outer membrane protein assembly factor BamB
MHWTFAPSSPEIPRTLIATPVLVHQEVAYVGCTDGRVYALDTHDGAVQWVFASQVTELCLDPAGRCAYVGSAAGVIYEIELTTGQELRRWIIRDLLTDVVLDEAYIGALTLAGHRLVFALGGGFSQLFVVLDRRTGALSLMDSSPGSFSIKALSVYAGLAYMLSTVNHQGEANALGIKLPDAPDRFLLPSWVTVAQYWDEWDADAPDQWDAEEVDVTATDGYLPVYDDVLYAVGVILRQHKPVQDDELGDEEEDNEEDDVEPDDRLLALDPRTGELLWSCEGLSDLDGYSTSRTLAAAYGLVFVYMGEYGMLDAVDIQTHTIRWRWRSPSTFPDGRHERSARPRGTELFIADGLLYVIEHGEASRREDGSEREGSMRIFALDTQTGAFSWSWFQTGDSAIGRELRSTIADGVLYLVGLSGLYALR